MGRTMTNTGENREEKRTERSYSGKHVTGGDEEVKE